MSAIDPINALRITSQTLVGYNSTSFPIPGKGGNCFSVDTDGADEVRIVNFGCENIRELIRQGLKFPIKCHKIAPGLAAICDGRIGERWYSDRFCEVCTPRDLLPLPQRLVHWRSIDRGEREEHDRYTKSIIGKTGAEFQ